MIYYILNILLNIINKFDKINLNKIKKCNNIFNKHNIIYYILGRKAMTALDSILKSRVITLPTKVRLVKLWSFQ